MVLSLLKLAVPFALLPSSSTPLEITSLANLSKITHLFVSEKLLSVALPVSKKIGLHENQIFLLCGHSSGRKSLSDFIECARKQNIPRVVTRSVKEDTLAYIVFSSGTSGLPKGLLIHLFL